MEGFDYHQPKSLKEAFNLMERLKGEAYYVAGGTDILIRVKNGDLSPKALVSLKRIDELKGFSHNGVFRIGGMTLLRDIERNTYIHQEYPVLSQATCLLADPQIRNVASIGGNLCNAAPSADSAPPLIVLEATLTLQGPGGERNVPIEDFFTGPGQTCLYPTEVLREIAIPQKRKNSGMAFIKLGRLSHGIALVNAAALLVMEGKTCVKCRLAVGAVAPVPLRLRKAEELLEGEDFSADLLERAAEIVSQQVNPISDVRATEEYRRSISAVLVKRALCDALNTI